MRFYIILGLFFVAGFSPCVFAAEKLLAGFEEDTQGWEIPDWALEKNDYVADSLSLSQQQASEGNGALALKVSFPGGKWTAAYIETVDYFDWSPYSAITLNVYLPSSAERGLKARIILTVGENWEWVEMAKSIPLQPGSWTTITANLNPGSTDWKVSYITSAFRQDIRKLGLRIESDMKPAYTGAIYIDAVRLRE